MDPDNVYAFLIAVEEYTEDDGLPKLKQSFNNVSRLHQVLKNDSIGIKNIKAVHNPTNDSKLILTLKNFANSEDAKVLIIYYAGHGILDDDGKHYLTLSDSTVQDIDITGLNITELNKAFKENKNLNIILILDSCFSEHAFKNFNARNHLVIASSARNRTSKYPTDADYSAFTNELITVLTSGIDNKKDFLTWRDTYSQLKINLENKGFPQPRISSQNEVEQIKVSRNNFYEHDLNTDEEWLTVIKEFGSKNPKFSNKVTTILSVPSSQTINKLKEIFLNSFPYPIAFYLKKATAVKATVDNYFRFYESVIQFLFIAVLIEYDLLDVKGEFKGGEQYKTQIKTPDHDFYFSSLKILANEFRERNISWFLKELDYFDQDFNGVINDLEQQKKQKNVNIQELRNNIFKLLKQLSFILDYRLISVKDVNLNYRKYDPLLYYHSISMLQGTEHSEYELCCDEEEKWQYSFGKTKIPKNNRSVLLIDCTDLDNIKYLNLWPLIIDKNTLDPKAKTPSVYVFTGKEDMYYLYHNIKDIDFKETKKFRELEAYAPDNKINQVTKLLEI